MEAVPPAITREEGCGDTANAPTWGFHPCSHVLKLHATAHPYRCHHPGRTKEKSPKQEQARKASCCPICRGGGRSPPGATRACPPQPGTHSPRKMKSQRLSFWCLAEHKNPALKTEKGMGGAAGEAMHIVMAPETWERGRGGSHHTNAPFQQSFLGK